MLKKRVKCKVVPRELVDSHRRKRKAEELQAERKVALFLAFPTYDVMKDALKLYFTEIAHINKEYMQLKAIGKTKKAISVIVDEQEGLILNPGNWVIYFKIEEPMPLVDLRFYNMSVRVDMFTSKENLSKTAKQTKNKTDSLIYGENADWIICDGITNLEKVESKLFKQLPNIINGNIISRYMLSLTGDAAWSGYNIS